MATRTEGKLGADLKIGDVVLVEGFRWTVAAAPVLERANVPETSRYAVTLTPADKVAASCGSRYARWTSGLRADLLWPTEVK